MVLLNIDYASRRHLLCPVSRQQLFVPRHGHRVSVRLVVAPSLLPVQRPATRFLTTSAIRYKSLVSTTQVDGYTARQLG